MESFVVALGVSRAFVVVWHKALISKLHLLVLLPHAFLISSFLSGRYIFVTAYELTSLSFPINSVNPQF